MFYKDNNEISFEKPKILDSINKNEFKWNDLVSGFNKKTLDNYGVLFFKRQNLDILKTSKDQNGKPFNIIELEMSNKRIIPDDDEPSSYINFYIANDAIIFPIFGDKEADENAEKVIKSQFPNRQIVCLDGRDILLGGGNIHCITQQQPRSVK